MRRPPWACEGLRGRLYTIQVRGTEPPSTGGGRLLFFQKGWVVCVCKRVDWVVVVVVMGVCVCKGG